MSSTDPIICGVDGSRGSLRAAAAAGALSAQLRSPLVLVHVVPPRPPMALASVPVAGLPVGTAQMAELDQFESEAAFAAIDDELPGLDAEHVIEHGYAPARLAALAAARDARFIVVGTHGKGAARSALGLRPERASGGR